ncbi:MAG: glutamate--tRNA ligase [Deltaproteobacteria bacterium]|jgi:glutamyl-tRNA synthetase|nr:glutamate--tRNA ligase [Deltaproteobacteria bacterium]
MTLVTRFAPSPTGHLHIGGARTALFCWLLSRHFGGRFHLRIEDTDLERSRQEYTDSILASMRWLGLDWDGEPVYQRQRTGLYAGYVERLLASGHAYWCSCTPDEIEKMREEARAKGAKPRYDGRCRKRGLGPGTGHVVRFRLPPGGRVVYDDMVKGTMSVDIDELDDMVVLRSDGMPVYNMAVVADDHAMGITHVVRGDDHIPNTYRQILLYQAMNLPLPRFGHVPMILGPDRQKLSKRHGARAVIEYEQDGLLPQALINYLVRLGWSHGDQEIFSLDELVRYFDGTGINPAPAAFDPEKLQWLNGHYLRETPVDELARLVAPFVQAAASSERLREVVPLYRERAANLVDLAKNMYPLLCTARELAYDPKATATVLNDEGKTRLAALRPLLAAAADFSSPELEKLIHAHVEASGLTFKKVAPPLRVALTGLSGGPGLPDILQVLGRTETLTRLDRAVR